MWSFNQLQGEALADKNQNVSVTYRGIGLSEIGDVFISGFTADLVSGKIDLRHLALPANEDLEEMADDD